MPCADCVALGVDCSPIENQKKPEGVGFSKMNLSIHTDHPDARPDHPHQLYLTSDDTFDAIITVETSHCKSNR
jgi:hypothetical protein